MSEAPLLGLTPSQTVGPYLHIGLSWSDGAWVVPEGTPGGFWITGTVFDGDGAPLVDALIETWQADPDGRFDHPDDPRGAARSATAGFRGFGRSSTEVGATFRIFTVRPGPLPDGDGGLEAPHLDVTVLGRGLLDRLVTRIYFPDEPLNETDSVLGSVAADRRATLVAIHDGPTDFRFDIRIQGPDETVFLQM